MKRYLCGECVKGATHERNGKPLQDSKKIVEISDRIAILAVADGHGSESCRGICRRSTANSPKPSPVCGTAHERLRVFVRARPAACKGHSLRHELQCSAHIRCGQVQRRSHLSCFSLQFSRGASSTYPFDRS